MDDETSELVIAVARRYRGRGVGRQLMKCIRERARRDGLRRLSLSVDKNNPAKRLHSSLGYVDYHPDDGNDRMIADLIRQVSPSDAAGVGQT